MAHAETNLLAVAVLDIMLPGIDGLEVLRRDVVIEVEDMEIGTPPD